MHPVGGDFQDGVAVGAVAHVERTRHHSRDAARAVFNPAVVVAVDVAYHGELLQQLHVFAPVVEVVFAQRIVVER